MTWDAPKFTSKLAGTVISFDKEGTASLCKDLIDYLRRTDDIYPEFEARRVLQHLRNKRYFDLMQKVSDALIQCGQDAPQIRRQYAQSLLDQSNLTAAFNVLQALVADTANDRGENAEARGLIGRAYKQLYVDANDSSSSRTRLALEQAVHWYHQVYASDPNNYLWHGINTVALLSRAERDGVSLTGFPDPTDLAKKILREIEDKHLDKKANMWDFATAAEACVALGKSEDALQWIVCYTREPLADAFELGGTLRQFTEVWQLRLNSEPGTYILPVLRAELLRRQGSHIDVNSEDLRPGHFERLAQQGQLEKVLGNARFVTYNWWQTAIERGRAVARIGLEADRGEGTGFLVRGGDLHKPFGDELLLMTNSHVVSNDPNGNVVRSDDAVVTFHGLDKGGGVPKEYGVKEVLWASPPGQLDATLLRLNEPVDGIVAYPIAPHLPVPDGEQRVYIIGHPGGGTLSFSIQDNVLLDHQAPWVHYRAPTEGGSSGSPVFNQQWRLVGIHHKGDKEMTKLNGKPGRYAANEGISIQEIIKALSKDLMDQTTE